MNAQVRCSIVCLGWLCFAPVASLAAQPSEPPPVAVPDAVTERIELFFRDISADRVRDAFTGLLAGSPLAKQTAAVDALVTKTPELARLYGPARNFEQITARRIGTDVLVLKYLYKCETFPVVWYFTVYRTFDRTAAANDPGRWIVVAVRFDTEIERLAE
ncbi:MAG: hypothetical protein K1X74_06725 [Pirellulales bacterium]|nr:hypothetical protein [Pirellulales bacterium]